MRENRGQNFPSCVCDKLKYENCSITFLSVVELIVKVVTSLCPKGMYIHAVCHEPMLYVSYTIHTCCIHATYILHVAYTLDIRCIHVQFVCSIHHVWNMNVVCMKNVWRYNTYEVCIHAIYAWREPGSPIVKTYWKNILSALGWSIGWIITIWKRV